MKKEGLLSEILNHMIRHEKRRAGANQYDEVLNQKKQLWYGIMNQLEPEEENPENAKKDKSES